MHFKWYSKYLIEELFAENSYFKQAFAFLMKKAICKYGL